MHASIAVLACTENRYDVMQRLQVNTFQGQIASRLEVIFGDAITIQHRGSASRMACAFWPLADLYGTSWPTVPATLAKALQTRVHLTRRKPLTLQASEDCPLDAGKNCHVVAETMKPLS